MDQSGNVNRPPEALAQNGVEISYGVSGAAEVAPERAPEGESYNGGPAQAPATPAPVSTQLPPIADPAVPVQQQAAADDSPLIAADDEVIEQEWVQKAKNIVSQTKGDPFAQEKEIGKLQADYIKKRYGKEIKLTDD